MARSAFFRMSLLVTLGFGLIVADLKFERSATWGLFLLYLLSAVAQRWIMSGRTYDVRTTAAEENARIEEGKRLYYCGVSLDSAGSDEEKTAIREILNPRRTLIRKIAKFGLIAVYIFLAVKFRLDSKFWDLFFFAGSIVILISATSGHMLLAFGLNAVVALPCALTLPSLAPLFTFVYLFLSCLTFVSHLSQEAAESPEETASDRETKTKSQLRNCAATAFLLFGLGAAVDFLFPESVDSAMRGSISDKAKELNRNLGARFSKPKASAPSFSTEDARKILRAVPRRDRTGDELAAAVEKAEKNGEARVPFPEGKELEDLTRILGKSRESRSSETGAALDALRGGSSRSEAEIDDLLQALEKGEGIGSEGRGQLSPEDSERLRRLLPELGGQELTPENIAAIKNGLEREKTRLRARPKESLSLEEARTVLKGIPKEEPTESERAAESLERAVEAAEKNGKTSIAPPTTEELAALTRAVESGPPSGDVEEKRAGLEALQKSATTSKPKGAAEPRPVQKAPEPLISESLLKAIIGLLKVLLIVTGVVLLYVFIRKLLAKHDPSALTNEKRRKLTREERATLLDELRRLDRAELSESEEIVARYGLFLDLMERIGFGKPPAIPPHEFEASLRGFFPRLDSAVGAVTDGFCDGFYGKWPLGAERLERFRADHKKIVRNLI